MIAHKPSTNFANFSGVSKFWLSIELADFNARRLWKHGRQRPISPLYIQILSSTCNTIAHLLTFSIGIPVSFFPFKWIEKQIGLLVWRGRLFSIFPTPKFVLDIDRLLKVYFFIHDTETTRDEVTIFKKRASKIQNAQDIQLTKSNIWPF